MFSWTAAAALRRENGGRGHCRTASSDGPAVLLTAALLTGSPADVDDDDGVSSMYLSTERRRAFMKKLTTVDTFRPSCSAIVAWISLLGRLISLKMATSVRRCISVNTMRGFLAAAMAGQDACWPAPSVGRHCCGAIGCGVFSNVPSRLRLHAAHRHTHTDTNQHRIIRHRITLILPSSRLYILLNFSYYALLPQEPTSRTPLRPSVRLKF